MKQGWEIKKLSEISKIFNGNSINEKVKKDKYTGIADGIPFIATKDIGFNNDIDYENGVKIPFDERARFKIAPSYTPLICAEGGSAGRKIAFTDKNICFGNKLFAAVPNKCLDGKYLYYYYFSSTFQKHFTSGIAGLIGGVSMNKFKSIDIPIPPIEEQKRIVAILDEAFAAIAKAKANAEQNLKNAKELFESVLNNLIIDNGKWKVEKLGSVCEIKGRIGYRGYTVQDLVQKGEGAITLSPSNIQDNKFITDKCTYISWFKYEESPEIMVFEGDILFVKTGSTYGKVALVENLPEKATINPQFVVLKDIKCSNKFLFYALTTRAFKEKVESIVGGAATPTLSQTNLSEQTIPLPPLKEQQTIVRQLDALRAETQKLEAVYQKKIADLEELKKSILQKAFAGELKDSKIKA